MNTQNLKDLIRNRAKGDEELYSLPCEVVSIDTDNLAELKPLNGDPNLLDVHLLAGAAESPVLITPAAGSVVLATFLSKDTAFISLYSEVESVQLRGEQFGGLIKIEELVSQLGKLTARVDGIIDAINNGVPAAGSGDGGTALLNTIKVGLNLIVDKEDFNNMENENVKHG